MLCCPQRCTNIFEQKRENLAKIDLCLMFSVVSCEEQCAPSQAKLLCVRAQYCGAAGKNKSYRCASLLSSQIGRTEFICSLTLAALWQTSVVKGERKDDMVFWGWSPPFFMVRCQFLSLFSPSLIPKHSSRHFCDYFISELC